MSQQQEVDSPVKDESKEAATWRVPALRGVMGSWVYYPALMTASQLSKYVVTDKDIREAAGLDDYLQRDLHPRVKRIVQYLKNRTDRFFPAIIIGIFDAIPGWIPFNLSSLVEESELPNFEESMGVLVFHGAEKMFALDGQHRVKAIQESLADPGVAGDQFAVIFVAHVDDKKGKVRTRRLFSDINKNAVKVSGGDLVIIDEDGIASIVTRRIFAEYKHFSGGAEIAITDNTQQVEKDDKEYFTSLLALNSVVKTLKPLYRKKPKSDENEPENVEKLQSIVAEFFDFTVEHVPSYNAYFVKKSAKLDDLRENNKDLLFRPVGLVFLAKVYVAFKKRNRLGILEKALKVASFESPGGLFDGILWKRGNVVPKAMSATVSLFLYRCGELTQKEESLLLEAVIKLRDDDAYQLPSKYVLS